MSSPTTTEIAPTAWRRDLVRWQQLVPPAWLAALVDGAPVVAPPAAHWRLFEVGCGGAALFRAGHIPGADYLDTNDMEHAPLWNKVADPALLQLLLRHGVRHDTTVVLYGRNALTAARAAHLMLYAGVADVRLLDGGLAAWNGAGGALAAGAARRHPPAAAFGAPFPARPDYLSDTAGVKQLLLQPDGALLSIRTWNEFIGRTSGYSYIDARGDIPGARWGHAGGGDDVNSMSAFHHPDGRMRDAAAIGALWAGAGVTAGCRTAFYCGTGWRASLAFYYAWLMDWPRISVYDGGWCEWSSDPANPVIRRVGPDGRSD